MTATLEQPLPSSPQAARPIRPTQPTHPAPPAAASPRPGGTQPGGAAAAPLRLRLDPPPRPEPAAILLALEAEIRAQASRVELIYHLVNESRRLLEFGQAIVFDADPRRPRALGISGVATVDRHQPVVRSLERLAARCAREDDGPVLAMGRKALQRLAPEAVRELPFSRGLWLPLREPGQPVRGRLLLLASLPWSEAQQRLAQRLATTYAHAWRTLEPRRPLLSRWFADRRMRFALAGLLALACVLPVPVSSLAPVEVTATDPFVVAAPLAGVVAEMLVAPNVAVSPGQPLLRFEDTRLRNELALGERRLRVANARLAATTQAAIDSAEASREVAVQRAERDLAQAQYDYARDLLAQSVVQAPVAGVVLYSDPRDWQGRPVETGQQILRIADPRRTEFTIQLPVQDSVLSRPGADVRVYLDGDPLHPVAARLVRASYHAERTELGSFAYRLTARRPGQETEGEAAQAAAQAIETDRADRLRIGMRGTAQVYGDQVPLIYALLRRPISALRQAVGW